MGTTRDRIRAHAAERKPVVRVVPEWDTTVHIRIMESVEVLNLTEGDVKQRDMIYHLLLDSLVDEDGAKVFGEEDRAFLEAEPFPLILGLFRDAAKVNGLPVDQLEEAMEDLAPTPDATSSTG